jgi:hypothetical protein
MSINQKNTTNDSHTENDIEELDITNQSGSGEEDEEDEDEEEDEEDDEERVPIDLSQNEIYRGVCTLLEDEDGNNILEYISLLHTELIGINKSLENLRLIRKEMTRIADCAELLLKKSGGELQTSQQKESSSQKKDRKEKEKTK